MTLKAKLVVISFDLNQVQFSIGEMVAVQDLEWGKVIGIVRGFEYWEEHNTIDRVPGVAYQIQIVDSKYSCAVGEPIIYEGAEIIPFLNEDMHKAKTLEVLLYKYLRSIQNSSQGKI